MATGDSLLEQGMLEPEVLSCHLAEIQKAVAAEREACAKLAESLDDGTDNMQRGSDGRQIADLIRTRS